MLSKRDYQVRPIEGMDSHVHAILQTSDGSMWVPATTPLTFILHSTGGKWMKHLPLANYINVRTRTWPTACCVRAS